MRKIDSAVNFVYIYDLVKELYSEDNGRLSCDPVNDDGMIDVIDATAVLVEYANLSTGGGGTFSDNQKSAGDVNSDDMINAIDASMILTFYDYLSTGGTESDMRVWLDM
ncbi:MAG: dockerin type I domain-containing protein [Clostridiales bacterium]|nr:dockerin type I domain-containing protein [Alistipes senegalensis]MCM1363304.1 dockerin type I domain-containing protein [Clostridiales bacterium]